MTSEAWVWERERELFRRGDAAAFHAVWLRHHDRLLARARLRTRDWDEADDLVQEMWAHAYERRHLYAGTGTLLAWLFKVQDRIANAQRRCVHRRAGLLAANAWELLATMQENQAGADAADDAARVVRSMLLGLSPRKRAIAIGHWCNGEPPRMIAARLGIRPGTVWTTLSRIRRDLRNARSADAMDGVL